MHGQTTNLPHQYNPDVGFVQGRDPRTREPGRFSVQLKFLPTENLLQTCKDYMDENYVLSVPVTINVPSQSLPVTFTFRAKLDFAALSFEPKAIDFGRALITQVFVTCPSCGQANNMGTYLHTHESMHLK